MIIAGNRILNGGFARDIGLEGFAVLRRFAMLFRIGRREFVHGLLQSCFPLIFQNIVCPCFDAAADQIHVVALDLLKVMKHIVQRRRGGQQRGRLFIAQIIGFQSKENVLPNGVFVGMVEDFFGRQREKPLSVMFLRGKALFIKAGVQFFIGHGQRTSVSCSFFPVPLQGR